MNVSSGCLVDNQNNGNTGQDYAHTSHDGGTGDPNHSNGNHYSYVTQMMSCTNSQLRRMPITSSNDLPHCSLILGKGRSKCLLSVLFDTGAALTTGYLPFHKHLIAQNSSAVHSFEEFDGPNPFDPIKLTGAITNTSDYNADKHGILSAVVRYFTPYCDSAGKKLLLPVALGNEMAVDTILGNTVISQWQMILQSKFVIILFNG